MSFNTLDSSGSSLTSIQQGLDLTSHNIANVNTNGYKAKYASFEDVISDGSESTSYSGTTVSEIGTNFAQGSIKRTGNPTGLALNGSGFFVLQGSEGELQYSRNGDFKLDSEAGLVDANGNYVVSTSGSKIVIPSDAVSFGIELNGEVKIKRAGQDEFETLDQLQLATFPNQNGLRSIGGNLFGESLASGTAQFSTALGVSGETAETVIVAGATESSNVELAESFADLIGFQRSFQAVARSVTTASEMINVTLGLAQ